MYFYDPGLVCSLLGLTRPEDISRHFLKGALFENLVFSELMKNVFNQFRQPRLYFWRDNTGNEIDCIFPHGDIERVIEIKSGLTISDDFFKGLNYYRKLSGLPPENFYLVYGGKDKQTRSNGNVLGWTSVPDITADIL